MRTGRTIRTGRTSRACPTSRTGRPGQSPRPVQAGTGVEVGTVVGAGTVLAAGIERGGGVCRGASQAWWQHGKPGRRHPSGREPAGCPSRWGARGRPAAHHVVHAGRHRRDCGGSGHASVPADHSPGARLARGAPAARSRTAGWCRVCCRLPGSPSMRPQLERLPGGRAVATMAQLRVVDPEAGRGAAPDRGGAMMSGTRKAMWTAGARQPSWAGTRQASWTGARKSVRGGAQPCRCWGPHAVRTRAEDAVRQPSGRCVAISGGPRGAMLRGHTSRSRLGGRTHRGRRAHFGRRSHLDGHRAGIARRGCSGRRDRADSGPAADAHAPDYRYGRRPCLSESSHALRCSRYRGDRTSGEIQYSCCSRDRPENTTGPLRERPWSAVAACGHCGHCLLAGTRRPVGYIRAGIGYRLPAGIARGPALRRLTSGWRHAWWCDVVGGPAR